MFCKEMTITFLKHFKVVFEVLLWREDMFYGKKLKIFLLKPFGKKK
jgi:hypothetical protein